MVDLVTAQLVGACSYSLTGCWPAIIVDKQSYLGSHDLASRLILGKARASEEGRRHGAPENRLAEATAIWELEIPELVLVPQGASPV